MKPSFNSDFKSPIIKCPHCGAEYLLGEVYMPGDLIGKPDNVVKDALGKLLYADYEEDQDPATENHFECEYCDKSFVVNATISVKTSEESPELDFSNTSASLLD